MAYIYIYTNKINGKQYVGKTTRTPDARLIEHLNDAETHRYNSAFHSAIRKYGLGSFDRDIIKVKSRRLSVYERDLIERLNTIAPNGYNLTAGGNGGGVLGRVMSEEQKLGVSKTHKGKVVSKETRKKMSMNMVGKYKYETHPLAKEVILTDINGTDKRFGCIKRAADTYKISRTGLMNVLAGRSKHCGGYKIRYV